MNAFRPQSSGGQTLVLDPKAALPEYAGTLHLVGGDPAQDTVAPKSTIPTIPSTTPFTLSPTSSTSTGKGHVLGDWSPPTLALTSNDSWDSDATRRGLKSLAKSAFRPAPFQSCLKTTLEPSGKSITWHSDLIASQADRDFYFDRHPDEKATGEINWQKDNRGNSRIIDAAYRKQLQQERAGEAMMQEWDMSTGPLVVPTHTSTFEDAFPLLATYGLDGKSSMGTKNSDGETRRAFGAEQKRFREEKLMLADDSYAHLAEALTSDAAEAHQEMDIGHWMLEYSQLEKNGGSLIFTKDQRSKAQSQLDTVPSTTARRSTKEEMQRKRVVDTYTTNRRANGPFVAHNSIAPLTVSQAVEQQRFGLGGKDQNGKLVEEYPNGTHIRRTADGSVVGSLITPSALDTQGSHAYLCDSLMTAEHDLNTDRITQSEFEQWLIDTVTLAGKGTQIILTDEEKADRDARLVAYEAEGVALHGERPGCTSCTREWCQSTHHAPSKMITAMIGSARRAKNPDGTPKKAFTMTNNDPDVYWDEHEPTDDGKRWNSKSYTAWLSGYNAKKATSEASMQISLSATELDHSTTTDTPTITPPGWTKEDWTSIGRDVETASAFSGVGRTLG